MEWNTTSTSPLDVPLRATGCNGTARPASLVMMTWVTEVGICLPVACMGVVGNILAFAVLCAYKQKQSITVYLQALALSDTLFLLLTILIKYLRNVDGYGKIQSIVYLFHWGYPLTYTVRLFNTWLTVLFTIDRCVAVRSPLLASRFGKISKAYIRVALAATVALAFSLVRFFEQEVVITNEQCVKVRLMPWVQNRIYTIAYRVVAFSLVMYFIPLVILIAANCLLLRTLNHADEERNELQAHLSSVSLTRMSSMTNASNITKIVVTIVIISICSSSFAAVAHMLWPLSNSFRTLPHINVARRYIGAISNILVTFNSAVNFVVYCLWSRKFRVVAAETLYCRTCRWRCNRFVQRSLRRRSQSSTGSVETKLTNVIV